MPCKIKYLSVKSIFDMLECRSFGEKSWLFIPFYTDPQSPEYQRSILNFSDFLVNAKDISGLNLAVVDDGCGLSREGLRDVPDLLVTLPQNMGKAQAIRRGLEVLLDQGLEFIVQYDGDGDQSYVDIPVIHDHLVSLAQADPTIPALVIGDRYAEIRNEPNPESIEYRQTILTFFGAIARQLGFEGVRDWVSGARSYTRRYAEEFLNRSKSSRYGIESEQLVAASLMGARVAVAPLTESRPRDPHTLTSKWLENFEVYRDHADALFESGKGHLVCLLGEMTRQLRAEIDEFHLDLSPIGENARIQFTRIGDRYTALIPWEERAHLFERSDAFTLKNDYRIPEMIR